MFATRIASEVNEFVRLDLTDATLLQLTHSSRSLLTTDLDLYLSTLNKDAMAVNFNHLRELPRGDRGTTSS